jgi:hypothetical protein
MVLALLVFVTVFETHKAQKKDKLNGEPECTEKRPFFITRCEKGMFRTDILISGAFAAEYANSRFRRSPGKIDGNK